MRVTDWFLPCSCGLAWLGAIASRQVAMEYAWKH